MKTQIGKLALCSLLASNLLFVGGLPQFMDNVSTVSAAQTEAKSEMTKVKGKITNISQKAKTIALSKKDKSFFLLKFNDDTELKGVKSSKEFKVGEAIVVHYKVVDGENIATSLQKALVKLPKGVKEVKTDELAALIKSDKGVVVIDARPPIKYAETHIEEAISLPYSKLVKAGDDGAKLLSKYSGQQLVFYCGGPT